MALGQSRPQVRFEKIFLFQDPGNKLTYVVAVYSANAAATSPIRVPSHPSYLSNDLVEKQPVTAIENGNIPLPRRFRSLKIWSVMRSYGVDGLKARIRNHVQLGSLFHSWILSRPDLFSVRAPPAFALTVITIVPRLRLLRGMIINGMEAAYDAEDLAASDADVVIKTVCDLISSRGGKRGGQMTYCNTNPKC